ncbi:hypothetical protein [Edaphobacter bradus]|uniref:hypothetical protein n=1 Tax=Edaphobacter bradus TaxID=2259016 RepID=UPI0021E07DBA|nr:hypothetical protein [Edaphobacter bradus]
MEDVRTNVAFQPWIGDAFQEGIRGQRILVLGESHYHRCDEDAACRNENDNARKTMHENMTRGVVQWWKDNAHPSPLSYRVPKLFNIEKSEFWTRVAFYNYLQSFAGPAARCRPSEEQWGDLTNAQGFQEILDQLNPNRILVLGKKLWSNLPSKTPPLARQPQQETGLRVSNDVRSYHEVDHFCYWYWSKSGHKGLAMPIMHPSASRFSAEEWTEPIVRWLSFSK